MADADSLLLEDTPDLAADPTQADTLENEAAADNPVEDPELEAIKQRVREMEEEAEKLKEMQNEVERQMNLSPTAQRPGAAAGGGGAPGPALAFPTIEEKMEADGRSVYVGNVDYGATAEELEAHFHGCGSINRVTILCDKFTGHPKGFAYIEFADKDSIETAKALDESLFRGRQIKVVPKRTNRPGVSTTDRPPRGRGYRGRGGGFRGFNSGYGGYGGYYPRRSRGFRSRRAAWYSPY